MKRAFLLYSLLLVPSLMPLPLAPIAQAQPPKSRQKQIDAIDLWAGVIRRGKTAKVMYQVADLLDQVCDTIDHDRSMMMEFNFRSALHYMKAAASTKAKGLDANNALLLKVAEQTVQQGQAVVRR